MGIKNENIEEVIANQKVGVIENFYNNYRLVMSTKKMAWRTYVM